MLEVINASWVLTRGCKIPSSLFHLIGTPLWRDACPQLLLGNPVVKIILFASPFLVAAPNFLVVTQPFPNLSSRWESKAKPPLTLGVGSLPDSSLARESAPFPGHSDRVRESHMAQARPMKTLLGTFSEAFGKEADNVLWWC